MPSDAEITLAFVAKRQGTDSMPSSAWAHVLSLELGWLAPGAARAFIDGCVASGLLIDVDDQARLAFDRSTVTVPNRYHAPTDLTAGPPSVKTPPAKPGPTRAAQDFPSMVERIAKESSRSKDQVLSEVTATQEAFGGRLTAEAAVVKVGLAHGVDIQDAARSALKLMQST